MADSSKRPKKPRPAVPLDDARSSRDPARPKRPPVVRKVAEGDAESFDFGELTRSHQKARERETRRRGWPSPPVVAGAIALFCAVIAVGAALWLGTKELLALKPVDDHAIDELSTLEFTVAVHGTARKAGPLKYTLHDAPEGARIDPETGKFTWRPTEQQGPGRYGIIVRVAASGTNTTPAQQRFHVLVREVNQPPVMEPIGEKTVDVGSTLAFRVRAEDPDVPSHPVRFNLGPGAPRGARIDPADGHFQWTPRDAEPGRLYQITVQAQEAVAGGLTAECAFPVRLKNPAEVATEGAKDPIDQFVLELRDDGTEVVVSDEAFAHPPLSGKPRLLSIDGQRVAVFGYGTPGAAERDVKDLTRENVEPYARSLPRDSPAYLFRRRHLIALCVGPDAPLLSLLEDRLGRPAFVITLKGGHLAEKTPSENTEVSADSGQAGEASFDHSAGDKIILELYRKNKLLSKREYPKLRKVFAERFENRHRKEIRQAFGEKNGEMQQWLDNHVDIKEEFYLAIDPEHDNVPKVLALFKELKDRFPAKIGSYANLAIAVAVVWDDERRAVHRSPCGQHGSVRPEGEVGAVENFRYFLDTEGVMQGRAQFLPWEFLVHVVDHRTPLEDRRWALTRYLPKRVGFGKCYGDVPYDKRMLKGFEPRLKDKPHTLPNILQFGGVCSVRADFAARVGKSIGVPAFSAGGESRFGEKHAWVMWVELGRVTQTGFTFSLVSHGRFRGDRYYVGNLNDPHTGQRTTDRQLELRLHTVGMDPVAKRQADLVMRSYPMLRERAEMDTTKQLLFLTRVIDVSPGTREAWIALAKMSREGQITKTNSKPMISVLNRLFTTFATLPDFTWVVFDDLISFQDIPKQRAALFGRLAALYEQAKRPDLSCKARLKYTEYLVADERLDDAILGLTVAILLFPEEGNFVPKMLDKLEELCQEQKGGQEHLGRFYQQFLPKIPRHRDDRPSKYCMQMYERGIQRFQEAGMHELAQAYQAQLALLQAARGK